ncbi:hypothetical protein TMatcc_006677 [Talaromyces marneffei ATCC 18224]
MVWRQLWPVVKERVFRIFQISLQDSDLPSQWRNAKIIPLKKPAKKNYALAKAWRLISLLSTLGKILEAVVAERISYAVEEFGLLPINHFGARKRRSAEQALLLFFDVQGAYNRVFKERLLQRLKARGIPDQIVRWIDAFCSRHTANILVNRSTSEQRELPQAGLPQGSPLSPILFLFFNVDLVQHRISASRGAIAFVDDYTAWVSGLSAEANRASIQAIIDRALDWERRSGATFECDKTAIVHFTRTASRSSSIPFLIKGEIVEPKESAKILGIVMDSQLRFKEHIANAATKGLTAAMALRRLKMTSPRASARSGIVGIGGHIRDTQADNNGTDISSFSITLGKRTEQNPYTAELEAMAVALERVPPGACCRWISILSSNRSAVAAISQPRQQSSQETIQRIYKQIETLYRRGNAVNAIWIPAYADINLKQRAKAEAQKATGTEHLPEKQPSQARSTAIRLALAERQLEWTLPENVGKYSKAVDAALPGKHTRSLYDRLNRKEAKILAQLRTGMTELNSYLNRIGAADSDLCACGQASETVEHFLFRCTKWTAMREDMNQCTESRRGNLSFFLGGKSRSDPDRWQPDMKAVQAVIKYAIATGRLEQEPEAGPPST